LYVTEGELLSGPHSSNSWAVMRWAATLRLLASAMPGAQSRRTAARSVVRVFMTSPLYATCGPFVGPLRVVRD
jgi:hypothetical protein